MVQGKSVVLIVEDDPGVTALEQRRLERAGYAVVTSMTAEQALAALKRAVVDLILLDFRLSGNVDGLDFYTQVKNAGFDVPVILVTGYSNEATVIRALRIGVRDFVTKSVEYLDYLPEAVERVLRQVRLERQLADSETRLSSLIDSAMDAIITMDADTAITLFNRAAEKMFRCPASQALGKQISAFISASTGDTPPLAQSKGRDERSSPRIEFRGRRADGESFPIEASMSFADVSGQKFATIIARDVTERKKTEKALRDSEARFQAFMDHSPTICFVNDEDGRCLYINQQVERALGMRVGERVGKTARDIWPLELAQKIEENDRKVLAARRPMGMEETVPRRDGTLTHWFVLKFPFQDGSGRRLLGGVAVDISERKQLEEQLFQAQKMEAIGRLAGGIAHDFNNLLTVITGFSDILQSGMSADDASRPMVDEIKKAGDRASGLTRQLLAFSRKQVLLPQVLSLNDLMADMDKMLRRMIGEDINLVTDSSPDLGQIMADKGQIEQVLLNLVVNARDAMPQGGKLILETRNAQLDDAYAAAHPGARPGPYVMVSVSDTGCGMTAEMLSHIFEPFFTTKGEGKGTGLGLATVFGVVKQSEGTIDVYSSPGQGTTFKLYFPRLQAPAETRGPEAVVTSLPKGTETILLVEDADPVRTLAREVLQRGGYTVLEAHDGGEALLISERYKNLIHLLVTDVVMPQLGGPALAKLLHAARPDLKVLYLSGYTDDAVFRHGLLEGETAFLQKPFAVQALARKVRDVLDSPHS
jgi:two-component system cell cycle sensor histidine kinase/response regulator CckA